jgi:membrane associated rhomboid family serine protease
MLPIPTGSQVALERKPTVVYGLLLAMFLIHTVVFIITSIDPGLRITILRTFGFIPSHRNFWALFTYVFVHAGWLHLLGNLIFLWIFGAGLEDRVGHAEFTLIFLTSGICSALIHGTGVHPLAYAKPVVGTSGAVAGILGAYLVLMPLAEIRVTGCFFCMPVHGRIAAFWFLPLWFLLELLRAYFSEGGPSAGVAYWAHVGGFLVGVPMGVLLRISEKEQGAGAPSGAEEEANIAARVLEMREGDLRRIVREGDFNLAWELYRRLDEEFPGILLDTGLQLSLASLAEQEGRYAEALALYRALANSNRVEEARARAAYRMGIIYLDREADHRQAARVFQILIRKFPSTDAARGAEEKLEEIFGKP